MSDAPQLDPIPLIRGLYTLDGDKLVPCDDFVTWSIWLATSNPRLAVDQVGDIEVSTVFLGRSPAGGECRIGRLAGPDRDLFETMAFRQDGSPILQRRYSHKIEAMDGHAQAVRDVAEVLADVPPAEDSKVLAALLDPTLMAGLLDPVVHARYLAIGQLQEEPDPSAKQAGRDAHDAGRAPDESPHHFSTIAGLSWRIGWNERAREQQD